MQLTFLGTSASRPSSLFEKGKIKKGAFFSEIGLPLLQFPLDSYQQTRRASAFLAKETRNFGGFFCARTH